MYEMIRSESPEYQNRFLNYLISCGMDREFAEQEYSAWMEANDYDEISNPEMDAGECLSRWNE